MAGGIIPSLSYNVDPRCDMACEYCPPFYENYQRSSAVLDDDVARFVFMGASEAGIVTFRLSGGEPLLRPGHVMALSSALHSAPSPAGIDVRLNTNGSRLAEHVEGLRDAGVNILKVSIDTLDEVKFREMTRSNRLSAVVDGVRAARRNGLAVELNMVYMRKTTDDVDQLIEFCVQENLEGLKILDLVQYDDPDYFLANYIDLGSLLVRLTDRYGAPKATALSSGRGVKMLEFQVTDRTRVLVKDSAQGSTYSRSFCSGCKYFPCQEGFYNLTLNSDGRLKPCRLITDWSIDLKAEIEGLDEARAIEHVRARIHGLVQQFYSDIFFTKGWSAPSDLHQIVPKPVGS